LLEGLIDEAERLRLDGSVSLDDLRNELRAGNLGMVADEIRELLGTRHFPNSLAQLLGGHKTLPTQTHLLLNEIPFFAAYTTNYDNLIESAYTVARQGARPAVYTHDDVAELANTFQLGQFYILQAHGTMDRVNSVVFGPFDYRRLLRAKEYREHFLCLLTTKRMLFLGYSLNDPDLLSFLEELTAIYWGKLPLHYALFDSASVRPLLKRHFSRTYGIEMVPWRSKSPGIPDIHDFLCEINREVRRQRPGGPPRTPQILGLDDLVKDVTDWLILIGFEIAARSGQIDQRFVDLRAHKAGALETGVLVRCIEGEVRSADIDTARAQLTPGTSLGL
jgi:hypothetical protein